ncbi:preprotein translocase subunit SecD [Sphingobacterium sp. DR205]|uniref:preprotein translocase subunit SecD n=1 Tax=Sphingobacterium sp. DR205 TaxID=2713573 RepID=UPI0013E46BDB|nr:preprotein translocase subunit SecD [Sphingobacterium sp. DR205]QIH32606.1 preprotein translocase subunit SecD [Sphingobacterium sp. DR205]
MAQEVNHYIATGKDRSKTISGQYGDLSGICLFEDGKFMLYGYATMVFGSYVFEKDYLLFYPDQLPRFQLYANHNPTLGDTVSVNFRGFEEGKTFVQFGDDNMHPVFNNGANCFDFPYVYEQSHPMSQLKFAVQKEDFDAGPAYQTFHYQNDQHLNDFIAIYNKPQRARTNFAAYLYLTEDKKLAISLSNYGGRKGFLRDNQVDPTQERWLEILAMKNEYDRAGSIELTAIFSNAEYNISYPDLEEYNFDKATNQYISKSAKENDQERDQDDRYLRQYTKEPLIPKQGQFDTKAVATASLFFASCDKPDKSYHNTKKEKTK